MLRHPEFSANAALTLLQTDAPGLGSVFSSIIGLVSADTQRLFNFSNSFVVKKFIPKHNYVESN